MTFASLANRDCRHRYDVAFVLVTLIPALTVALMVVIDAWQLPNHAAYTALLGIGLLVTPLLGHLILARYPVTLLRLRRYVQYIAAGTLPDSIDLMANEDDIVAIETAMGAILDKLRNQLDHALAERDSLQSELFQLRQMESVGTLAQGIAHEINSPLQCISANLYFIREVRNRRPEAHASDDDTDMDDCLQETFDGLQHVTRIVNAMQHFGNHDGADTGWTLDVNAAIRDAVELSRSEWKRSAEVKTDFAPDLPRIFCHPSEIKQSLLNVIVNAAQAIAESQPSADRRGIIRIRTRSAPGSVVITVDDDGPGIASHVLPKVFDPFFTTRRGRGAGGQGLSFAFAAIAQRHNGRIHLDANECGGTSVHIELPLTCGHDDTTIPSEGATPHGNAPRPQELRPVR